MFFNKKEKRVGQTIAIKSGDRGLGATHISLCIANSLSLSGNRVAIIEWNMHSDFSEIEKSFKGYGYESRADKIFRIRRVDYYQDYKGKGLAGFKKENYDYIIADLGNHSNPYFAEADYPVLVVSGSEWRAGKLLPTIMKAKKEIGNRLKLLVNLGNQEEIDFFQKRCQVQVYGFPFWKDAFTSNKEQRELVHKIIL